MLMFPYRCADGVNQAEAALTKFGDRLSRYSWYVDWSRLDTRLDTSTSLPSLSEGRLWLLATCTLHLSVSAMMQTASARGSSSTGCCTTVQLVSSYTSHITSTQDSHSFVHLVTLKCSRRDVWDSVTRESNL